MFTNIENDLDRRQYYSPSDDDDRGVHYSGRHSLLPTVLPRLPIVPTKSSAGARSLSWWHSDPGGRLLFFLLGFLTCIAYQSSSPSFCHRPLNAAAHLKALDSSAYHTASPAPVHPYPPAAPTNVIPFLFPTKVGYSGPTATGAEPALLATAPAYPFFHRGAPNLAIPKPLGDNSGQQRIFNMAESWGNMPPRRPMGFWRLSLDAVDGPDFTLSQRLKNATLAGKHWTAAAAGLSFLNKWSYKLGDDLLTFFERHKLFIEARGFSNALAPDEGCPNALDPTKARRDLGYTAQWRGIYLQHARLRHQLQMDGFDFDIGDVYEMQRVCSPFATFHQFEADPMLSMPALLDLEFWYSDAHGSPLARALGIGYVQRLIARLTHTPITTHNSSTDNTLDDNPIAFPLDNALYADATHEDVMLKGLSSHESFLNVVLSLVSSLVAVMIELDLTNFAATGPLPVDHIPKNRSFSTAELAPLSSNMQFQHCASTPEPQIRIVINDGVVPLTGLPGVHKMSMACVHCQYLLLRKKKAINETDWDWACRGNWTVPPGAAWNTTTGEPPKRPRS
ncbi:hypothetical protein BOTBODRAFT_634204 [Botryobasidium botryosum FD-172 SS1]|uniref:Uncharacterized protein n=1 Tax=Botryobasidium botryosum (strain FD-172 SS1) TaxID=930990 RepID=A0A067MLH0_BOTB1|nr:hypothetical protein BOTBODRAFT_634204 [Botryobasidium botryosum FD-172 SS1]